MFLTDWRLTLFSLASIPLLLIATYWFKRSIKSAFQDVRKQVSALNTFVQEHIVGMYIVQCCSIEKILSLKNLKQSIIATKKLMLDLYGITLCFFQLLKFYQLFL